MKVVKVSKVLTVLFVFSVITYSNGQEMDNDFKMKFSIDRGELAIECKNGCSWTDLWVKEKSFYLNENGMINIENNSEGVANSKFVIKVIRKGKKVTLNNIKGTELNNLEFKLSKQKGEFTLVDNNGLVNVD